MLMGLVFGSWLFSVLCLFKDALEGFQPVFADTEERASVWAGPGGTPDSHLSWHACLRPCVPIKGSPVIGLPCQLWEHSLGAGPWGCSRYRPGTVRAHGCRLPETFMSGGVQETSGVFTGTDLFVGALGLSWHKMPPGCALFWGSLLRFPAVWLCLRQVFMWGICSAGLFSVGPWS